MIEASNDACWSTLERAIDGRGPSDHERSDVIFVLGAGVSVGNDAKYPLMPSWRCLVTKLASGTYLAPVVGEVFGLVTTERRWRQSWTEPRIIEAVRSGYPKDEEGDRRWVERVRACLYEDLKAKLEPDSARFLEAEDRKTELKDGQASFAKFVEDRNPTLARIVQLCVLGHAPTFRPNPRIAAVLTYNIDELVQKYDRARHITPRVFRTIERASTPRHFGKLPLYHLHGLLKANPNRASEAADSLVLSEAEYHQRMDHVSGFATTTMLWALREHVCVFIGCSMTDTLTRRSLIRAMTNGNARCGQNVGARPRTRARSKPSGSAILPSSNAPSPPSSNSWWKAT